MADKQPRRRPAMNVVYNSVFHDSNETFHITVPQADHALHHYEHLMPQYEIMRLTDPNEYKLAQLGIMGACLAHAMGWTPPEGKAAMQHNTEFQGLVEAMIECATILRNEGQYPTITARLS